MKYCIVFNYEVVIICQSHLYRTNIDFGYRTKLSTAMDKVILTSLAVSADLRFLHFST